MSKGNSYDKKCRKFVFEVWQESTDYDTDSVLAKINAQPVYAYILHDKDKNEETDELKKPHFQGCLSYGYPLTRQAVANKLGIPVNMVEPCNSWKGALRYLMHLDHFEKYQYSRDSVHTNIPTYDLICGLVHEGSVMASVFDMLDGGNNPFEIVRTFTYDPKMYSIVRRNWTIIFAYWKARPSPTPRVLVDMDAINFLNERLNQNETLQC